MVDVGDKNITSREALAKCVVNIGPELTVMLRDGVSLKKGNEALTVARLAGTMAAKKTSDLIPLCHQLQLRFVNVKMDLDCEKGEVIITSHVKVDGKTGCELEALTAVTVAALALYDMCKAVNKGITITNVRLIRKSGGKSGDFISN
jgi:cyclic pyranopterin phosphate synthase